MDPDAPAMGNDFGLVAVQMLDSPRATENVDLDQDGFVDIYLNNLQANILYRNRGDGTFRDVTAHAGVGDAGLSSSSAFGDYDLDGDLDLYVCNYVRYDFDSLPERGSTPN